MVAGWHADIRTGSVSDAVVPKVDVALDEGFSVEFDAVRDWRELVD